MTKITKEGLKEEMDAVFRFCYQLHHENWLKFCENERNGKQSLEELSMLVKSLTSPNPWRVVLGQEDVERICNGFSRFFAEFKEEVISKMNSNEKLVDKDR